MRRSVVLMLALTFSLCGVMSAHAVSSYVTTFNSTYPAAAATLGQCKLCHINPAGGGTRNGYGNAFAGTHNYATIASLDSDGDGFTNIAEITALTWPGDATSHPAAADTTAPTVSAFTVPATSTSLTVTGISITASDNVAVTGYMINESATAPASGAAGWSGTAPTSYVAATAGAHTLFAWAKDAAGNVSTSRNASVTITLPDTTAPTVSAFTVPATSASLTVTGISITASDNVAVTGYMINESATAPASGAAGWSGTAPTSYVAATAGAHTLFAWAKDAAGNVSTSRSAGVTITLPDTTAPTVTGFTVPATSSTMTIPVTLLTASDNVAVTGYMINESATAPASGAAGWSGTAPTAYTAATAGAHTLFSWAKDAAGNVSTSRSASVTVTISTGPNRNILWRNTTTGAIAAWSMSGVTKTGYVDIGTAPTNWQIAGMGDFNGDGQADILWRDTTTGAIAIWYMNGTTKTGYADVGIAPTTWQVAGIGDCNGDGQNDILWRNTTTGVIAVWYMNGITHTGYAEIGSAPATWQIAGMADFNGDGKPDILWRDTTTGAIAVWYMNGTTKTGYADVGSVPTSWQLAGIGDFNGDGQNDILWRNTATGAIAVWYMNGIAHTGYADVGGVPAAWQVAGIQ